MTDLTLMTGEPDRAKEADASGDVPPHARPLILDSDGAVIDGDGGDRVQVGRLGV